MKTPLLFALLATAAPVWADLSEARKLMQQDAAKAVGHLEELLKQKPNDPWLLYNSGVAAYASRDFAKADQVWQQLASTQMPDELREEVWTQIGNVSYRLVQPQIATEPDTAVARLEQSREAFRVALAFNKNNATAAQNVRLIEKELEEVYARLAKQLVAAAKKEEANREKTIERLQAALSYAQQAQALNPKSPERAEERKAIEKALAEAHDRKAAQHEKTADQRKQDNQWERQNAQEELQKALDDFQQAQAIMPEDQASKEGEKRVQEKLAASFNNAGRKEQQAAREKAKNEPQLAVEKFEKALENFQEALAHAPEHQDAKAGEKEVTEELAKLHLEQGDKKATAGEQQAPKDSESAAKNLLGALENFEQAKALAPENQEIQPRIDKVEAQLPQILAELGQKEQKQATQAEARNAPEKAIAHLEKAETSFDKAQQLAPKNEEAKLGQQQVQDALARLRQQVAERAEQKRPGPPPPNQKPQEAKQSFDSMLAKLKEELKPEEMEARHRAGQKYDEDRNKTLRNW